MRLNEVMYDGRLPIEGYGPGFFRIGGQARQGPQLILPSGLRDWGGYADRDTLTAEADDIDVLLLGTGAEIAHAPADFRSAMEDAGIGVEVMASPAACRTYNVLLGEGRRIGAALLPAA